MPRIVWTRRALAQVVEARESLLLYDAETAEHAYSLIIESPDILERFPDSGRPVPGTDNYRELLIPYGSSGYVALYKVSGNDVFILAVRHQRQAGY